MRYPNECKICGRPTYGEEYCPKHMSSKKKPNNFNRFIDLSYKGDDKTRGEINARLYIDGHHKKRY